MKAKILITGWQNIKYFRHKFHTMRWDYCYIVRSVKIEPCPFNIYDEGCYGSVTICGKKFNVTSDDGEIFSLIERSNCN